MAFDEVQFPPRIAYGSRGGPVFLTDVVRQENAFESRVAIYGDADQKFNARSGIKSIADINLVVDFFYARMGKFRGFRYKDFRDFEATLEVMTVDGSNELQLVKSYGATPTFIRTIRKPVASPAVTMRRNSTPFAAFSLDLTTGIATLTPDATNPIASSGSLVISAISQANPAVVTTPVNDFIDNDYIRIDAGDMVEIVTGEYIINQLSTTTFELVGIDSTLFTAYTTGGTARQPGISRSNPARIRSIAHGYASTEIIFITAVVGMTQINGLFAAITIDGVDRFDIAIDSTLFTEYTSGGDAEMHLQPGTDVMDWTGEFDVPVRFDIDEMEVSLVAFEQGDIPSVPMVGLFND